MSTFEIGNEYIAHSACDHDCIFKIRVTGRTEKTVAYLYEGKLRRSKILTDQDGEFIMPDRYSMAPVFRAWRAA